MRSIVAMSCASGLLCGLTLGQTRQFADSWRAALPRELDSRSILAGDIDNDGDPDVIVAGSLERKPRIYINVSPGRFVDETAARMPQHDRSAQDITGGDFNGDGHFDFVMTGLLGSWLLTNDGSGKFSVEPVASGLPSVPGTLGVEAEDVDRDGDLDVIFGAWNTARGVAEPRLFENDGKGKFTDVTARLPKNGSAPYAGHAFSFADIDGDTDLDLAVSHGIPAAPVRLWINDGSGAFTDETVRWLPTAAAMNVQRIRFLDVERDGRPDLLLGRIAAQDILYRNRGDGFVDATRDLPSRIDSTGQIAVADLDADGDTDVVVASIFDGTKILRNDGTRFSLVTENAFAGSRWPHERYNDLAIADFDCDGDDDILLAHGVSVADRVLWNLGGMRFEAGEHGVDYGSRRVAIGRLDGGLLPGIATAAAAPGRSRVVQNRDFGGFVEVTDRSLPPGLDSSAFAVAMADLDGDGDNDILRANRTTGKKVYLRNEGAMRFSDVTATRFVSPSEPTEVLLVRDLNGDGKPDVVAGNAAAVDSLYLNDGTGRLLAAPAGSLPSFSETTLAVGAIDIDRDGDADLAVIGSRVRLYRNDGRGRFDDVSSRIPNLTNLFPSDVAAADLNGDGHADLVIAGRARSGGGGQTRVLLNDRRGSFVDNTNRAPRNPGSEIGRVAVGDTDDDGDVDIAIGTTLWLNDGSARFVDASGRIPQLGVASITDVELADLDLDGDLDLYLAAVPHDYVLWNLHRQVDAPRTVIGEPVRWHFWAHPGYATEPVLHLAFVNLRPLSARLRFPPYGLWGLDLAGLIGPIILPSPIPGGRIELVTPAPGRDFVNARIFVQSLVVRGSDVADARYSNVLRMAFRHGIVAPKVLSTTPADGTVDVARTTRDIVMRFDKAMDLASLQSAIRVRVRGNDVTGAVTLDATRKVATFRASADLQLLRTYEITVAKSAKSNDGVALGTDRTFSFLTADGKWTVDAQEFPGEIPTLVMTDRGDMFAVYRDATGKRVLVRRRLRGAAQWSQPFRLDNNTANTTLSFVTASADRDGNLLAAWVQSGRIVVRQGDAAFQWGAGPQTLPWQNTKLRRFSQLRVAIRGKDRAFVAWRYVETDNTGAVAYASRDRRDPSFPRWQTGVLPAFQCTSCPFFVSAFAVTIDHNLRESVVSSTLTGTKRITVLHRDRSNTPTWRTTFLETGSADTRGLPHTTALADGQVLFVWRIKGQVWANVLRTDGTAPSPLRIDVGRNKTEYKVLDFGTGPFVDAGARFAHVIWPVARVPNRFTFDVVASNKLDLRRAWGSEAWGGAAPVFQNVCGLGILAVVVDVRTSRNGINHRGWVTKEICSGDNLILEPLHPSKGVRPQTRVDRAPQGKISNLKIETSPTGEAIALWLNDGKVKTAYYR